MGLLILTLSLLMFVDSADLHVVQWTDNLVNTAYAQDVAAPKIAILWLSRDHE